MCPVVATDAFRSTNFNTHTHALYHTHRYTYTHTRTGIRIRIPVMHVQHTSSTAFVIIYSQQWVAGLVPNTAWPVTCF